jgi:hypothetical protein
MKSMMICAALVSGALCSLGQEAGAAVLHAAAGVGTVAPYSQSPSDAYELLRGLRRRLRLRRLPWLRSLWALRPPLS